VRGGNVAAHHEAEPEAERLGADRVRLQARAQLVAHARARILDRDQRAPRRVAQLRAHPQAPAARHGVGRVHDEVEQRLAQARAIGGHLRHVRVRALDHDAAVLERRLHQVEHVGHELGEVHRRDRERLLGAEHERGRDQELESLHFAEELLHARHLARGRAFREQLQMQLDAGERVTDLVGEPGGHVAERGEATARGEPRLVLGESRHHRVERLRERTDLVRARQVEALPALAGGDAVGERRQLGQRPRDVAHQREQQRREQRRRREHGEPEPQRGTTRRRARIRERGHGDERRIARIVALGDRLVHRHARRGIGEAEGCSGIVPGCCAASEELIQRGADLGRGAERYPAVPVEQHEIRLLQRGEATQQFGRVGQAPRREHRRGVARLSLHALLQRLRHDSHADGPRRPHRQQQRSEQRHASGASTSERREGHAGDATARSSRSGQQTAHADGHQARTDPVHVGAMSGPERRKVSGNFTFCGARNRLPALRTVRERRTPATRRAPPERTGEEPTRRRMQQPRNAAKSSSAVLRPAAHAINT
jgi:hypothetical protein